MKTIIILVLTIFFIVLYSYYYYYYYIKLQFVSPQISEELVVSVCTENLDWIDKRSSEFKKVTVYNKCDNKFTFRSPNVVIRNIPNIGSCDNAFLTYIIERYNSLPDRVEFTKGSQPANHKYVKCMKCNMIFNGVIKCFANRCKNFLDWNINDWKFTNNSSKKFKFHRSPYNMKEWVDKNKFLNSQNIETMACNVKYGGQFGATREQIMKHPIGLYDELRKDQTHPNEEIDHFIERIWGPLLCYNS